MLSPDPDAVLARLRAICLALPQAEEIVSHGAPAFRVGKMFAWFRHDHHGDGLTVVCVKTTGREEQEFLVEVDPETYSRPAYLWPSGWVSINLAGGAVDWDHVAARVQTSWRMAAPAKLSSP